MPPCKAWPRPRSPLPRRLGGRSRANAAAPASSNRVSSALAPPGSDTAPAPPGNPKHRLGAEDAVQDSRSWRQRPRADAATCRGRGRTPRAPVPLAPLRGPRAEAPSSAPSLHRGLKKTPTKTPPSPPKQPRSPSWVTQRCRFGLSPSLSKFLSVYRDLRMAEKLTWNRRTAPSPPPAHHAAPATPPVPSVHLKLR